jgi:hypothetical protein
MSHQDRHTHQLKPGDAVLAFRAADGQIHPALTASCGEPAIVTAPPIRGADLAVIPTSLGPCVAPLEFRWLLLAEHERPRLRLVS